MGLLAELAEGRATHDMTIVESMSKRLNAELPLMLEEHKVIRNAAKRLAKAGRISKDAECEKFAEKVIRHSELEEQVLYPASIIIGEYLRLKLGSKR